MNGGLGWTGHDRAGVSTLTAFSLQPNLAANATVCSVLNAEGLHVGSLKLIGGIWKFKAIGYDAAGHILPGGGPLTHRHNTVFTGLDAAVIGAELARI